jgi:hypothetical protein
LSIPEKKNEKQKTGNGKPEISEIGPDRFSFPVSRFRFPVSSFLLFGSGSSGLGGYGSSP